MSAEPVSEVPRFSDTPNQEPDFATELERAASRERVARRVEYTAEMLRDDGRYAVSFVAALIAHQDELSAEDISRLLHEHITPMSEVMDTIDDTTLDSRDRMIVHLSRLTSARGRTDQNRFATRRQQDPVLRRMDAAEAQMPGIPPTRAVAILRLVDLRASIEWEDRHDAWFRQAHYRLSHEFAATSTT